MLGFSVYNGAGKVRAVRDKYVFDFPASADINYSVCHILKPVRVKSITVTAGQGNFASYVVRKNSVAVSLPVDLIANDNLVIELTGWNNSHVQLEVGAEPIKADRTLYAQDLGGNGRYLFCVNYISQSISIIDTGSTSGAHPNETHPTTNLALPAGHSYRCVVYRAIDQSVYVFGANWLTRIDANPASPAFKTVVQTASIGITAHTCCYDYNRDNFYLANRSGNNLYRLNAATLALTNINFQHGLNFGRGGALSYIAPLEAVFVGDETAGQLIIRTEDDSPVFGFGLIIMGQLIYNPQDGKIYQNLDFTIGRRDTNPIKLTQSVNNDYFRRGDLVITPNQRCFGTSVFSNNIGVVNISGGSMASLGFVAKTSPAANEAGSRSIVYSPYSQRVYVQAANAGDQVTGVNRVHILNPTLPLANMYAGYCDVGNMDATGQNMNGLTQMCLNQLKL